MIEEEGELSNADLLRRYAKAPAGPDEATPRSSPFKFLDSYGLEDADIFFGRDAEIEELLRLFHSHGHVLIYGESGCGKSSLVQCGLRSRIPGEDALFLAPRVHGTGLPNLCRQIYHGTAEALNDTAEIPDNPTLVSTLREVCDHASRPVVLFFDQFEELFIFHDAAARRRFVEELAAVREERLNVKVIIGIRQDYLAFMSELEDIVEDVFRNRFWLRRMSRETAASAVVQACESGSVRIDQALADAILHRLDPDGEGVELPYLQVVMDRLYRKAMAGGRSHPMVTQGDVEELGDITDILGNFLIEEVGKLSSPETGRQVLKGFVTSEGTRRSLTREAVAQEASSFGETIAPEVLDEILGDLTNVRILRELAHNETFELRHDALARTVSSWISEVERELIEVRDNVRNRHREYEARGRPASALLDHDFLEYLEIYRKRLASVLDEALVGYIDLSRRRLRRERSMKRVRVYGSAILVLGLAGGLWAWSSRHDQRIQAEELVEDIRTADAAELNAIIEHRLPDYRGWVSPQLERIARDPNAATRERLRASLALVEDDDSRVHWLWRKMLVGTPEEFAAVREGLKNYSDRFVGDLWDVLGDDRRRKQGRLFAGMALADYDPQSDRWNDENLMFIARELTSPSNIDYQLEYRDYLLGIASRLYDPLEEIFLRDPDIVRRSSAAKALVRFAAAQPEFCTRLIGNARGRLETLGAYLGPDRDYTQMHLTRSIDALRQAEQLKDACRRYIALGEGYGHVIVRFVRLLEETREVVRGGLPIVVGGKDHLESSVLLEIMAQLIEAHLPGARVIRRHNVGATANLIKKLESGDIQLYAEYTATILSGFLPSIPSGGLADSDNHDAELINRHLDQSMLRDVVLLRRFSATRSYLLTVNRDWFEGQAGGQDARGPDDQVTISRFLAILRGLDSSPESIRFLSSQEFLYRPDGRSAFLDAYGAGNRELMDFRVGRPSRNYATLLEGNAQVMAGYDSDPEVITERERMLVLEDDQKAFAPSYAAALANGRLLKVWPQFGTLFQGFDLQQADVRMLVAEARARHLSLEALSTAEARSDLNSLVASFLDRKGLPFPTEKGNSPRRRLPSRE